MGHHCNSTYRPVSLYIYMFGNNFAFFRSQARVNSGNSGLINDHSKVGSIPHHSIAYFDTIE